jgi:hypothetical protein
VALQSNDLALLTARFGVARFGASRFGFIPCPEDVEGAGNDEPGEYIWREVALPTTDWTLVAEDCVCRNLCTLQLATPVPSPTSIAVDSPVTVSTTLSGAIGLIDGIARINWGDGSHAQQDLSPFEDGAFEFTHTYYNSGNYTITVLVHDERGCEATTTLDVTVISMAVDFSFIVSENGPGLPGPGSSWDIQCTPVVTGGSGNYSYAWSAWDSDHGGSEGAPDFTDTVEVFIFNSIYELAAGGVKVIVTDVDTLQVVETPVQAWSTY